MSLQRLTLKDFVIVDFLDIEMSDGFTVLTGETGTGKSILIDALQLLLGQRADSTLIRQGCTRCELSCEWDTPLAARPWLEEHGLINEENTLLIRRSIDNNGKSRAWVNGHPATLQQLRHLADFLVHIHGQHAWHVLSTSSAQLALIDDYAGIDRSPLINAYKQWKQLKQQYEQAQQQHEHAHEKSQQLQWQLTEIAKLSPQVDEWSELNASHTRLSHAHDLIQCAQNAIDALEHEKTGATTQLNKAYESLQHHQHLDTEFQSIVSTLQESLSLSEDALRHLQQWQRSTVVDHDAFTQIDQRLTLWMSMSKRFRVVPEELPLLIHKWKEELNTLQASLDIEQLQQEQEKAFKAYQQIAQQIHQKRQQAASKLAQQVSLLMQNLGMKGGAFDVQWSPTATATIEGISSCEFIVAPHPHVPLQAVQKIASGGELSRIALAIAVASSQVQHIGTLIFDEIDAGIGGLIAQTVGELMRQLGQSHQVLAITHLPQVAVCAHHHWQVQKYTDHHQTLSRLQSLQIQERTKEISRMLGGQENSMASLAHAQEMLQPYASS